MTDSGLEYSQDSDEDLLLIMAWTVEDPQAAQDAFAEFHRRHVRYLFGVCHCAHEDELGRGGVEELVQNTFWKAYASAATYVPNGGDDRDAQRLRVRAWLGTIAGNLLRDEFRRQKRRIRLTTGQDELIHSCPERSAPHRPLSPDEQAVQRGMTDELDDRERCVLECYAQHYDPESPHQYPPDGVIAELCERFRTTPENIRQIRCRALRKLKSVVEEARFASERIPTHVPR